MDDQQREHIIQIQRQTLMYGTVVYERGLDLAEKTGWIGTRDMARPSSIFAGVSGGGAVTLIIVADRDEPIMEQNSTEVPFHRVVEIQCAPHVP